MTRILFLAFLALESPASCWKTAQALLHFHRDELPLVWAANEGQLDNVRLLLSLGTDPNLVNQYGDTALTKAIEKGHSKVAYALVEGGADPRRHGAALLGRAAADGRADIVRILLKSGTDPDSARPHDSPPLMQAIRHNHPRSRGRLAGSRGRSRLGRPRGRHPLDEGGFRTECGDCPKAAPGGGRPGFVPPHKLHPLDRGDSKKRPGDGSNSLGRGSASQLGQPKGRHPFDVGSAPGDLSTW